MLRRQYLGRMWRCVGTWIGHTRPNSLTCDESKTSWDRGEGTFGALWDGLWLALGHDIHDFRFEPGDRNEASGYLRLPGTLCYVMEVLASGPDFGRLLVGRASESVLRPAEG